MVTGCRVGLIGVTLALAALSACGALPRAPVRTDFSPAAGGQIVGVWRYQGGEAPPFDLTFNADGVLVFRGGVEHFNPASWRYDPDVSELRLTLNTSEKWITAFQAAGWAYKVNVPLRQVFLRLAPVKQSSTFAVGSCSRRASEAR
jgi:hypothetical protein